MITNYQPNVGTSIIRCNSCSLRYTDLCPMRFTETYYDEKYEEWNDVVHDNTSDNGYCNRAVIEECEIATN